MKQTIAVPDSWNEITVGQFKEIASLDKDSKDYTLALISILLDRDPEEIRKYDMDSVNAVSRHLEWIATWPEESSYKQEIIIDGVKYELIENLNRFSNGEWFDMEDCMEDVNTKIDYLFAMLYRPRSEEYSAAKCHERAKLFSNKAMIGDLYGCLVFFSNVGKRSMLTTQAYLMEQILNEKKK